MNNAKATNQENKEIVKDEQLLAFLQNECMQRFESMDVSRRKNELKELTKSLNKIYNEDFRHKYAEITRFLYNFLSE